MKGASRGRRIAVAIGLFGCVFAGSALLVKGLYPVDLPRSRDPDFLDSVFANRAVLLAARMLLVSAAAVLALGGLFIAVSIGHRMKNGEWLRRAGPFEISERKLARAEEEIGFWQREALASEEKVVALHQRLERMDELATNLPESE